MTTRDQQIAAAVREAAAKIADAWPYVDSIRALDIDAILASVPKQEDADRIEQLEASLRQANEREARDYNELLSEHEKVSAALAKAQEDARGNEIPLNIIRKWPEGFQDRLEHVWRDLIGFIPNYKLYDLQRVLAEFGFTMKVFAAPDSADSATERKS